MGMFSVDENIGDYINNCTFAELTSLSQLIAQRKEAVKEQEKSTRAKKLKEAFDNYCKIINFDEELTVEIQIADKNGYSNTYSVELAEAIVTSQNNVVFKAYNLDLNDY